MGTPFESQPMLSPPITDEVEEALATAEPPEELAEAEALEAALASPLRGAHQLS